MSWWKMGNTSGPKKESRKSPNLEQQVKIQKWIRLGYLKEQIESSKHKQRQSQVTIIKTDWFSKGLHVDFSTLCSKRFILDSFFCDTERKSVAKNTYFFYSKA